MTAVDKPKMLPLPGSLVDGTPRERGTADVDEITSVQRALAGAAAPPSPLGAADVADAARRRQLLAEDSAIDAGIMNVRIDALMSGSIWSLVAQVAHFGIRAWWDSRRSRLPQWPASSVTASPPSEPSVQPAALQQQKETER